MPLPFDKTTSWGEIADSVEPIFRLFVCWTHQGYDQIIMQPGFLPTDLYNRECLACGCLVPLNQAAFKAIGKKGAGVPRG